MDILLRESLPAGNAPEGAFHSAETVAPEFFKRPAEIARDTLVRTSMPFLHYLIHSMLAHANRQREAKRQARIKAAASKITRADLADPNINGKTPSASGPTQGIEADEEARGIEDGLEVIDGIKRSVTLDSKSVDAARLAQVSPTGC